MFFYYESKFKIKNKNWRGEGMGGIKVSEFSHEESKSKIFFFFFFFGGWGGGVDG